MHRFFARVGGLLEWLAGDQDLVAARAEIAELGDDVTIAERTWLRAVDHGFSAVRIAMAVVALIVFPQFIRLAFELFPDSPRLQIAFGAGAVPLTWLLSIRPRVLLQTAMIRAVIARVRRRGRRQLDAIGSSSSVAVPIGMRSTKR